MKKNLFHNKSETKCVVFNTHVGHKIYLMYMRLEKYVVFVSERQPNDDTHLLQQLLAVKGRPAAIGLSIQKFQYINRPE